MGKIWQLLRFGCAIAFAAFVLNFFPKTWNFKNQAQIVPGSLVSAEQTFELRNSLESWLKDNGPKDTSLNRANSIVSAFENDPSLSQKLVKHFNEVLESKGLPLLHEGETHVSPSLIKDSNRTQFAGFRIEDESHVYCLSCSSGPSWNNKPYWGLSQKSGNAMLRAPASATDSAE